MTDELLIQTAANVVNRMMRGNHFSICDLDKAADLIGVPKAGDAYAMLRKLHCVSWEDMPKALREQVPALMTEVLSAVAPHFDFGAARFAAARTESVVEPHSPPPRTGFMRLLGRG